MSNFRAAHATNDQSRMTTPNQPDRPLAENPSTNLKIEGVQFPDGSTAIVRSQALRNVMLLIQRVAQHNASVLIVGETGSGKELIARAIHHYSRRSLRTFVDVNCAALPEHLVESELFGYEKGAFSGAEGAKPGLFELADQGTLFLDEIGELDPKVQVKLLRVLDGIPYYRLGGQKKIDIDVRVVAATNQDMEMAVKAGRFRRDLYYRLSQFQLRVPPLRERPDDVAAIAEYALRQHSPEARFTADALDALQSYSWPGNVRELKNVIFKAVMNAKHGAPEISAADLALENPNSSSRRGVGAGSRASDLDDVEKRVILETLTRTGGHRGKAAERLGISRRTLSRKLKQYKEQAESDPQNSLGQLSYEQQRYFRVVSEFPVAIRSAGKEVHAMSVNLSSSGIAVRSSDLAQFRSNVIVTFTLPGMSRPIESKGEMAWIDSDGKAGFRFQDMPEESQRELESWLQQQISSEGWTGEPALAQHL